MGICITDHQTITFVLRMIYIYPSLFSFRFFLLAMTCTKHLTTRTTHFAKASEASRSGNQVASITAKLLLFALSSLSSHPVDTTDWEDWTEDMIRLINERVRQLVTEVLETRYTQGDIRTYMNESMFLSVRFNSFYRPFRNSTGNWGEFQILTNR